MEKMKNDAFFYKCLRIWNKKNLSQESHPEKDTKNVIVTASFDGVPTSLDTSLPTIQPKRPENIVIDQAHMQLMLRVRAMTQIFGPYIESTDLKKKRKQKWNLGSETTLEGHKIVSIVHLLMINARASKNNQDLKLNSIWSTFKFSDWNTVTRSMINTGNWNKRQRRDF